MKKITIILILIALFSLPILSQSWKSYPYYPPGSSIVFPNDEAYHLKGDYSPYMNEYWYGWFDFYTDSGKHFPVIFCVFNSFSYFMNVLDTDNPNFYSFQNDATVSSYDCVSFDHLRIDTPELKLLTKTDGSGNLIPFKYTLNMQFDNANLNIDIDTTKRPLMDGGDGYLPLGENQFANYYSLTGLNGEGYLTLNGNTYHVSGKGWMEHVWGDFYWNFTYEWWCLKLSNNVDICFWTIFDENNRINYGNEGFTPMTGYIDDNNTFFTTNFKVTRTKYFLDKNSDIVACSWHLECDNPEISLDLNGFGNVDQSMDSGIWEEYGNVSGKYNGEDVNGIMVSEHDHNYDEPEIEITEPSDGNSCSLPIKLKYEITNWDDGYNLKYKVLISYDGSNYRELAKDLDKTTYGLVPDEAESSFYVKVAAYSSDGVLYGESYPIHLSTNGNTICDFNNDGVVDSRDLGILLSHFGENSETYDLNGDGKVNGEDVNTFKRLLYYNAKKEVKNSKDLLFNKIM